MEKKKVVPTWLSVVLLALLVIGIGFFIYAIALTIPQAGFNAYVVLYLFGIIKSVFAIIYCVAGYKKNAAGIFKAYCICMTVAQSITVYLVAPGVTAEGFEGLMSAFFFLDLIACGNWFVLTIAKDLGKKTTFWICGINVLISVIIVFLNITFDWRVVVGSILYMIGYVVAGIMFYCKYADKAARGAK